MDQHKPYNHHTIETYPADIYALREYRVIRHRLASIATHTNQEIKNSILLKAGEWTLPAVCNHAAHININPPNIKCTCGYWGVWDAEYLPDIAIIPRFGMDLLIVTIQIKGKAVIGSKGVRANKIRIVGTLHPLAAIHLARRVIARTTTISWQDTHLLNLDSSIELERSLMRGQGAQQHNILASNIPIYPSLASMTKDFPITDPHSFDTDEK